MRPSRIERSSVHAVGLLACLTILAACSPHRAALADSNPSAAPHDATVFSDTALYRQVCTEANSGLTPASGRCTPRDQSVRPVRPAPPGPPALPQ